MTKISLLNGHLFVFILVVILATGFFILYAVIRPETTVPYNFNPFPQIAPTDLPDPSHLTENCWNKLTPCDKNGQCPACGDDYECTTLSSSDAPHYMNGIPVPTGIPYCLKKKENTQSCNAYTGRWLWVDDPEFCSGVNGKTQCWKCECVYPHLYAGDSCSTQLACQNYSQFVTDPTLQNNFLTGTKNAPTQFQGKIWDPTSDDTSGILNFSPMTTTEDGKPWFDCPCTNPTTSPQYLAQLPKDPYTCHLDPCYAESGWNIKGVQCSDDTCLCNCSTNAPKAPSGTWQGTCVQTSQACGDNSGYDPTTGSCTCAESAGSFPQKCRSNYVNQTDATLPFCTNPENPLGSECLNPCSSQPCENGGICTSLGPTKFYCDCSVGNPLPPPFIWSGPTCSLECIPNGTDIGDEYNGGCCCSGASYKHGTPGYGQTTKCGGSWHPGCEESSCIPCSTIN